MILLDIALSLCAFVSATGPTMGWSSWNTYRVNISDSLIMAQADAMVNSGLANAGYSYINIDDGYFGGRDGNGRLLIHPRRFPSGLKPVVDHIHSLGLKAGIYSDAGRNTCGNFWDNDTIARGVGLYGHDDTDAAMFFTDLGFDFIKVDFCGGDARQNADSLDLDEKKRYEEIRDAVRRTGRGDVRINACRWDYPGTWVDSVAFSWRISHDISPSWWSVKDIISQNIPLSAYCRNGGFNDMDMLEVGRGMTADEDITHFAMWCVMSSPLLIGCDLQSIDGSTLALLSNPELIAVNQDSLHIQAYPVARSGECYLLVKDIGARYGNRRVFAVYNPSDSAQNVAVRFDDMDLAGEVALRDLIHRRDAGTVTDSVLLSLAPHATAVYAAEATERLSRRNYEAETALISCYSELRNPEASHTGRYVYDDACSGGLKAAGLGYRPDNDLVWDKVYVTDGGRYRLTFDCMSDGHTAMTVSVNGRDCGILTFDGDGSGSVVAELNGGENVVRIYNTAGAMPDVDCMLLSAAAASY